MINGNRFGYYVYDGDGRRATKSVGDNISGGAVSVTEATLYPASCFVMDVTGGMKHYYAGTEHIAARPSSGGLYYMNKMSDSLEAAYITDGHVYDNIRLASKSLLSGTVDSLVHTIGGISHLTPAPPTTWYCTNPDSELNDRIPSIPYFVGIEPKLVAQLHDIYNDLQEPLKQPELVLPNMHGSDGNEKLAYFYHGDHLGSAAYITNQLGGWVQYLRYMPYGELLCSLKASDYDERFKFTGQEFDPESGYYKFDARYYNSGISGWMLPDKLEWLPITVTDMTPLALTIGPAWLSVDPLSDKFPDITPYAYCNWNPIKYVDPDGQWVQVVVGAAVSAAADVAFQVGMKMYFDGASFGDAVRGVKIRSVVASAAAGAIGVGVVSKVSQAAKLYKLGTASTAVVKSVASPVGDAVGSVVSQQIVDGEVKAEKVKDAVIGGVIGSVVGGATMNAIKKSSGFKILTRQLDHADRVAAGSSRPSRNQALQNAQTAVDNYGVVTTQTLSSAASTFVSKLLNEVRESNTNEQEE